MKIVITERMQACIVFGVVSLGALAVDCGWVAALSIAAGLMSLANL